MDGKEKQLDRFLEETLYYQDLPGLCVSLRAGGFRYLRAVGFSDAEAKEPLREEQPFHMASVTKLMTGISVLRLAEQGKLRLEERLADVVPEAAHPDPDWGGITLEQMLSHTAGIGDVRDYHWRVPYTADDALERYARSEEVAGTPMLWAPGTGGFRYSNIAYELLGRVIEKRAGVPYDVYVKENILRPLGMEDAEIMTFRRIPGYLPPAAGAEESTPSLDDLRRAGLAMPHTKDEENHIRLQGYYPYNRMHGPSSTLTCGGADIGRFADAILRLASADAPGTEEGSGDPGMAAGADGGYRLLSPATLRAMWTPRAKVPNNNEDMGLSWFMRRQDGCFLAGHEGTDDGFRSSLWICPEKDCYVAVMSNISRAPVKKINKKIFHLLNEME